MSLGADWLVNGCSRLSRRLKISAFAVSALIMGVGANIPEILITIMAPARGLSPTIIPHIITGVMINILGIIGLCAIARPISVKNVSKKEIFVLISASGLMTLMLADGRLGALDGALLLGVFAHYAWDAGSQRHNGRHSAETHGWPGTALLLVSGMAVLYCGGELFMDQLRKIVDEYDLSKEIAGALIVAPGTSGPEIMVSILAIMRRQPKILTGNIAGSCIAHIMLIAGAAGLAAKPAGNAFGGFLMLLAVIIFSIDITARGVIARWRGILYLALLGLYFSTILI
jgi:cation:H+ antiporter